MNTQTAPAQPLKVEGEFDRLMRRSRLPKTTPNRITPDDMDAWGWWQIESGAADRGEIDRLRSDRGIAPLSETWRPRRPRRIVDLDDGDDVDDLVGETDTNRTAKRDRGAGR